MKGTNHDVMHIAINRLENNNVIFVFCIATLYIFDNVLSSASHGIWIYEPFYSIQF